VRLLLTSMTLSEVGDWAARGALSIILYQRTGSAVWSAMVIVASLASWAGPGQVLSAACERFPKRTVMVISDVLRGVLFLVLIVDVPALAAVSVVFVAALATPVYEANRAALLREFSSDDLYPTAVAAANVVSQVALVGGYLSGAWLVATVGASKAMAANAVSFLVSAVLVAMVSAGSGSALRAREALRRGVAVFRHDPVLRWGLALVCVTAVGVVGIESIVVPYVLHHLGARTEWVGVALASIPIGTLLTSTLISYKGGPRRQLRVGATVALTGVSVALVVAAFDPGLPAVLVMFAAAGASLGCVVPGNAVLGSRLPRAYRATAISFAQGALMGAQGLGALLGGGLATWLGSLAAARYLLAGSVVAVVLVMAAEPSSAAYRLPVLIDLRSSEGSDQERAVAAQHGADVGG